jgi:hypothetical protein
MCIYGSEFAQVDFALEWKAAWPSTTPSRPSSSGARRPYSFSAIFPIYFPKNIENTLLLSE